MERPSRFIVLCRHGATEFNRDGRFLSYLDPSLTSEGRDQAIALRPLLSALNLQRAYVSPMLRCRETLTLAAPDLPFDVVDELREVNFGAWEGRTLSQIERDDPYGAARRVASPVDFRPPGGESFEDVAVRLREFEQRRVAVDRVLIVAHRGTLAVLERMLRGLPLDYRDVPAIDPAGFRVIPSSDVPGHVRPSESSKTSLQ